MTAIKHILAFLLAAFLLGGCQPLESQQEAFLSEISALPGLKLSLVADGPASFSPATVNDVYRYHDEGRDVWLFAGQESLDDAFESWLDVTHSLAFQVGEDYFWFIPADKEQDQLSFVLDHHLEQWLDRQQLARLWRKVGERLRNLGEFDESIKAYENALELAPDDVDSYVGLGADWLGLGKSEQALKPLLQAISLEPENYWAQRLLGNAYLNLYRYELAVAPLTRAYLLRPDQANLLIAVALSLGRSGQEEQALRVLDEAALLIDDPKLLDDIRTLREEFSGKSD